MSGREKTIKTPKMVKLFKPYQQGFKGSISMFARQFDTCLEIVNKVVRQDLQMTKIWAEFVPKSLTKGQMDDIDYESQM